MTLDAWLAIKGITPADFGRTIGLKWPYQVRRYLQVLANGKLNRRYHPPARRMQLKIRAITSQKVTLNDWPDPVPKEPACPTSSTPPTVP